MAKAKKVESGYAELNKKFKGFNIGVLSELDLPENEFIPTGNYRIDKVLGGGFAKGRLVELYGMQNSGKTSLSLTVAAQAQAAGEKVLFVDLENTFDPHFAELLGVRLDELVYTQAGLAEDTLQAILEMVESGEFGMVILDSVAALMPRSEAEGDIGQANIGRLGAVMGQAIRKLTPAATKTGTCLVFINQLRSTIGGFTGPAKDTPGGAALKFFSSQRVEVKYIGQIKEADRVVGGKTIINVVKNKLAPPMQKTEVEFYFDRGFCNENFIIEEAMEAGKIVRAGSWFKTPGGESIGQKKEAALQYLQELKDTDSAASEGVSN